MHILTRTADTVVARNDARHGPLPTLLLVLTMVTGLVDAVSYLKLGHVFVANMTGNVVFLGFTVADAKDYANPASLVAIAVFLAGGTRRRPPRLKRGALSCPTSGDRNLHSDRARRRYTRCIDGIARYRR